MLILAGVLLFPPFVGLVILTLLSPRLMSKGSGLMETIADAVTDPPTDLLILAAGLLGCIAVACILHRSARRRFQHPEQIEAATDLTVLTSLPELADGDATLNHALREPSGPYAQALRTLHMRLVATSQHGTPLTVAITSTTTGEGRSILAASLGRLLAREGRRVLLIDCDWHHPDQHNLFKVSHDGGLTRLLEQRPHLLDDAIHTDPLSGLDFITTGRGGRLGARMLLSDHMRQTLAACTRCYELVILDLPPVQAARDVLLLARLVDRILFVIRWNHVGHGPAMAAMTRLRKARGRVAGIALTRMKAPQQMDDPTSRFDAAQHQPTTE